MIAVANPNGWIWLLASFLLSAGVTWLSIRYALHRNLLDLPGQRRSHSAPTPRGGGLGIVIAVVAGLFALAWLAPATGLQLRLIGAVTLVAAVGWIDDHRPLPAWSRLLVQMLAVALWLAPLILSAMQAAPAQVLTTTPLQTAVIVLLLALICLWSINLHNFMDGIDGLLALQSIFVLSVLMVLCRARRGFPAPPAIRLTGGGHRRIRAVQFSARSGIHGRCRQRRRSDC